MRSYFWKKYLYLFFVVVVMPAAIFAAVPPCTGYAFMAGSSILSRQAGIPHYPFVEPFQSDMRLSPGKFLVAARSIRDPRFRETVILLVTHDSAGAMGLIINLPTGVSISSALPEIKELRKRTDKVFIGGPVGVNQLFLLIRTDRRPEGATHLLKHTFVSSSMKTLRRVARDKKKRDRFRVFAGYAGWSPGQLEREVAMGSWHVMEADEKLIFAKDPSGLWQELISRSSGIMVRLLPDEPSGVREGAQASPDNITLTSEVFAAPVSAP
ncbi:MAG: YqgE/AlgH family protein [Candidatus Sulfobium sp.]